MQESGMRNAHMFAPWVDSTLNPATLTDAQGYAEWHFMFPQHAAPRALPATQASGAKLKN